LKPTKPRFAPKVAKVASVSRVAKMLVAAEERGPILSREEEFLEEGGDPEELHRWGDPDEVMRLLGSYTGDGRTHDDFPMQRHDAHKLATQWPKPPEVVFSVEPEVRAKLATYCSGLDCETKLIQPGRNTPTLVVTGYQAADGRHTIVGGDEADPTTHARAFLAFTDAVLRSYVDGLSEVKPTSAEPLALALWERQKAGSGLLTNQNIAFDFCCIAEAAHQADVKLGLVGKPESWFDAVMSRIFEALDLGCVEDTMLRERLIDLAEGTLGRDFASLTAKGTPRKKRYTLASLSTNYLNVDLDKLTYRLDYYKYHNKPVETLSEGAQKYVTDDVEAALQVATQQQVRSEQNGLAVGSRIPNSSEQTKAAFSLQLVSSWGCRTSLSKVQELDAELDHWQRKLEYVLKDSGLIRKTGAGAGSRDMKRLHELVREGYKKANLDVPLTKSKNGKGGGNVSTKGSVLEDIAMIRLRQRKGEEGTSEDRLEADGTIDETELFNEPLYAYSQYASVQKLQTTYLPTLYSGTDKPINTRFETLLETGRISSYKPNLNNLPRGGTKTVLLRLQARVRECFVPRPGFVFSSVDYAGLELATLAQVYIWFFGSSKMADAINAGMDLHTLFAADQLLHLPYEEVLGRKKEPRIADMRQLAKPANFGFGGAMGAEAFCDFAKQSYNVYLTVEEAKELKTKWLAQWEMAPYFAKISTLMKAGYDDFGKSLGDIEQFISGRIRGKARYCAVANGFFQSLAADGAKAALYTIQKESYLQSGRLYGARCFAFLYDETILELPEERAADMAPIQAELMIAEMEKFTPDVKITAVPALMRCWIKSAEAVYDASKRLIPWEHPVPKALNA
jgi:DNA polymerase-1